MLKMDYKLVIITRTDLKLSAGKLAVQVAHAAVSCAVECRRKNSKWYNRWFTEGQKKVVVQVPSLIELKQLKKKAEHAGLTVCMINDAGLTEVPPGTVTCIGVGPAPNNEIDKISGNLPLL
jgi:PTH2 family peptidyl-tRNA hydrolase